MWNPREMIRTAEGIAWTLRGEDAICGVAVTGSLTRFEFPCSDIDVAVMHNGRLPDVSISYPPKSKNAYFGNEPELRSLLSPNAFSMLPKSIPADYIFVNERALWDCVYLQSLKRIERFTDFYLRVFNDPELPLVLFRANETYGGIRRLLEENPLFSDKYSDWFRVRHNCNNPLCKPKQTWAEARREMEARKGQIH